MDIRRYEHYIGGKHAPPVSGEYFASIDPSCGQPIAEVARGNTEDINRAVEAARQSLATWRKVEPSERGRILHRVAARILGEAENLARQESLDTGFPLRDCLLVARAVAARYFEYYGGLADKIGGETIPVPGNHLDYTLREPLGVVAQIIPWNSPLYDGSRGIAPALAAGNTIVLKPAEEAMLTMLRLAEIMTEEGVPKGVFNVVTGYGPEAGATLAGHPDINGVSFTGSVETGTQVMKMAADNVVPVSLELGGKSANIIFADSDLDTAVMWAMMAIFTASGQICTAGSRLLLERKVHDEFLDTLVARTKLLRVGPGLESPDLGPLISQSQLDRVLNYISSGKAEGAEAVIGGERLTEGSLAQGYFVAPTIFAGVENRMRIAQEEIFGPVLSVLTFETPDEALEIANGTQYGLAAAVWTRNLKTAHYLASRLEVGSVYINRYYPSGVEAPSGGYKRSGFGRVDGIETLRHFTQIKNVVINLD